MLDIKESEKKFTILSDFTRRMLYAPGSPIKFTATYDPRQAISGADFILNQFRSGLLAGRIQDEKIPLNYNLIGQETTGMGGMASGIRSFPIIENYVDLVKQDSNNGWIINFTNPSGMLTEFIINYLYYDRCIGLCNVPIEFILQAAEILKCKREDVLLKHYGLNHLSWVDRFMVSGEDKTDEMLKYVNVNMENIPDIDYDPEFITGLGMLPNPYLKYFYSTGKMLENEVKERDGKGTRGEVVQKVEKELLTLYAQKDRTKAPEELSKRGGYMYSTVACELIASLALGDEKHHIVNTKNNGAITGFPDDYIMEISAIVDKSGPKPIKMGEANKAVTGLVQTIKNYERLTIEGYLNNNENLIKQAMLIHPLGPDESQLNALWSDLKAANDAYFPK
ncbi:MAG: 6-phospho-beta-glucosidase, partial [Deltaproteobacteria bacterium]|nr:6-phospho-beta-glucosidase [Deltaproteobacteria bacterium]